MLIITPEISINYYNSLIRKTREAPIVPVTSPRTNKYVSNNKSIVTVVRSNIRSTAFHETLKLLGDLFPIFENVNGPILLKPNCNTDDAFPASTHIEMINLVLDYLIIHGISPDQIVIGDMSGRGRGLPTKWTMENMGLARVAREHGIHLSFFEEEEWVTVKHPKMYHWPEGLRIPRRLYTAERVISLPAMKTHMSATFTLSLKNSVGISDALGREWLHNGEALNEKIAEMNLAYTADLIILDGIQCFVTRGPSEGTLAYPGVLIAGGDRVAIDTIGVSVLKKLEAENLADKKVYEHLQLKWAEEIGLGNMNPTKIDLRTSNLEDDPYFVTMMDTIKDDLSLQ